MRHIDAPAGSSSVPQPLVREFSPIPPGLRRIGRQVLRCDPRRLDAPAPCAASAPEAGDESSFGPSMWRSNAFWKAMTSSSPIAPGRAGSNSCAYVSPADTDSLSQLKLLQHRCLAARRPGAATMRLLDSSHFRLKTIVRCFALFFNDRPSLALPAAVFGAALCRRAVAGSDRTRRMALDSARRFSDQTSDPRKSTAVGSRAPARHPTAACGATRLRRHAGIVAATDLQ